MATPFALAGLLGAAACSPPPPAAAVAPPPSPVAASVAPAALLPLQPSAEAVDPPFAATPDPDLEPPASEARPPASASSRVPSIRVPAVTVGPSYPPELIHRVIRQSSARFTRCFEKARRPVPSSRATLRFTIAEDGKVSDAAWVEGGDPINPDPARLCVLNELRGLAFPQPGSKIIVSYPLNVDSVY